MMNATVQFAMVCAGLSLFGCVFLFMVLLLG